MTVEFWNRQGCLLERRENLSGKALVDHVATLADVAEDGDQIIFRDSETEG